MRNKMYSIIAGTVLSLTTMGSVYAGPIEITFDQVGELADATFGGSGIANDQVAITRFQEEICTTRCQPTGLEFTLGLSAHGRYENLLEGTDGAGTYYASTGSNIPPSSSIEGATWNFDYYIDIQNGSFEQYGFKLFYDFDSAAGNDESTHGVFDINMAYALFGQDPLSDVTRAEGSQNLMFSFLGTDSPFITAPSATFDANAAGEYSFALAAFNGDTEVARTAINVVVQEVPEPGVLALLGLGFLAMSRRFRK